MRKVIITAGHNGPGTGASSPLMDEGTETIRLRDLLTAELKERGMLVTNDTNTETTAGVIGWIKRIFTPNDLLIEIHFNSSTSNQSTGTETFIQVAPSYLEKSLADSISTVAANVLMIKNRGVKFPSQSQHITIGILDQTQVHAILWEVCFLNNPRDVAQYRGNAERLAREIAHAVALSI